MSNSDSHNVSVPISCLCGKHQHVYGFPKSTKTLDYFICHCDSCRSSSGGSLYQGAIVWTYPLESVSETKDVPEDPKSLLKHYPFGPTLDFWFCETCSTKMYWQYKRSGAEMELFPGLIPRSLVEDGGVQLNCLMQVNVEDTLDEGLSRCFRAMNGQVGTRRQASSSGPLYEVPKSLPREPPTTNTVTGECHCGSVQLTLVYKEGQKYAVELDTSDENRLLNSVDISVWALVDRGDIVSINDMPLHIVETLLRSTTDGKAGPLASYQGTSDKYMKYFCNKCSATIFVRSSEDTPVRIGAGLLKSQSGSRCEDVLDWGAVQPVVLKHRNIDLDPGQFRTI